MKRKQLIATLAVLFAALAIWTVWGNTALMVSRYTLASDTLPEAFSGLRIAQVSDLHNAEFGEENEALLSLLEAEEPDLIVLTGDLVDSYRTDTALAADFAAACAGIAPTYYVTGNHEARIHGFDALQTALEACGVTVLRDETAALEWEGAVIGLIGADDPGFHDGRLATAVISAAVEEFDFTVLLAHRPELFEGYASLGVDVVLSGHAHGGQFRLPLVGGLIAPGQGLFPAYDAGIYTQGGCRMVVSRGLGNSIIPLRFNNRPELVIVTLT